MNKIFTKLFLTNWLILLAGFSFIVQVFQLPISSPFSFIVLITLLALALSLLVGNLFLKPIKQLQKVTQEMTQVDLQNKMEMMQDKNELEAILSNMVEGVMVIGRDEKIMLLNAPVYEMLELRSRETIGKPYWEIIRNDEINTLLKEAITQKKSLKKEITIISPEESQFLMQISAIMTPNGHLSGVVAVFHDITELKKLAKLRSEFVANVSHEFKTPLTSIKGFVETLRDGAIKDKEKSEKFLSIIQKHTEQLEQLVNDLLSLSTIESKEVPMEFEILEIEPLLQTTINLHKGLIEQRKQQIILQIPQDLPAISLDMVKMGEVFSNLLNNAIKFTPVDGKITIAASKNGEYVRVDFKDSGIGIEQQHLGRIFERFYRVDKGRSREMGGTGLGLAIVKHIIQSHNGKISVESEFGKGSTFSVFLPY
jgi:two-component system phosphate regulon sensor histidine kinase PhoR